MTDHIAALSRFSSSAAALCGCALHTTRVRTRDRSMPPPSALEDSPLKRRALRLRARRGATRGRQHGALATPTLLSSRGTWMHVEEIRPSQAQSHVGGGLSGDISPTSM